MKNKICSITTISTSMETFMLPEAIALKENGWDSIIISNISNHFINKIPKGIRYYSVPMERTYNIFVALMCIYKLYIIFRKEKPKVVQYGTTHACLFGSISAFLARVPHRIFLQWGPIGYNDFTGLKRTLIKNSEVLIAKLSTEIRAVSLKNMLDSINDGLYNQDKVSIIGIGGTIGVDLSKYDLSLKKNYKSAIRKKYNIDHNTVLFAYVGRICKPKGVNELIKAFKRIIEKYECMLMLIGPNEDIDSNIMLNWASKSNNVIITGAIQHEDMPKYFSAIDVLIHPTHREGFGMVLQEAMAMEVPIITTDIPGPSEAIEDGISGKLFTPKDVESLYLVMEDVCKAPNKWEQYGKNGRKRVEKYFERNKRLSLIVEDKNKIVNS